MNNQKKEVEEFEVCTRYLQPVHQKLFDSDTENMLFQMGKLILPSVDDGNSNQNRPDGWVENDSRRTIGFFEVKTIKHAKDHKKVNLDLHRLCMFSKAAMTKVQAETYISSDGRTNAMLSISTTMGDVVSVVELDHIRLPLSLDELPQFIPCLSRLYNIVETIYKCCYNQSATSMNDFGSSLEPQVIKAITEKTTDRNRDNCFYYPYH